MKLVVISRVKLNERQEISTTDSYSIAWFTPGKGVDLTQLPEKIPGMLLAGFSRETAKGKQAPADGTWRREPNNPQNWFRDVPVEVKVLVPREDVLGELWPTGLISIRYNFLEGAARVFKDAIIPGYPNREELRYAQKPDFVLQYFLKNFELAGIPHPNPSQFEEMSTIVWESLRPPAMISRGNRSLISVITEGAPSLRLQQPLDLGEEAARIDAELQAQRDEEARLDKEAAEKAKADHEAAEKAKADHEAAEKAKADKKAAEKTDHKIAKP